MKRRIEPHLMPLNHPAKAVMDRLFAERVTKNATTLAQAGFVTVSIRPFSYCVVARHPELPGYLLKIYLDSESRIKLGKQGWEWLVMRCEGAAKIRNIIKSKQLKHFSVPDKWLYPLPARKSKCGQPLVLLVSDMNLVSQEETDQVWKTKVNREHLQELYYILCHGGASCHIGWNIPYTRQGQFSCIDTEHPDRRPNFAAVKTYLSKKNGYRWDRILKMHPKETAQALKRRKH